MKKLYWIIAGVVLLVLLTTYLKGSSTMGIVRSTPESVAIEYMMVPTSNPAYSYPQIINYPDLNVMNRVNQALTERYGQSGCDVESVDEHSSWDIVADVNYAKNKLFVVNAHGSYNCGGAYPTNAFSETVMFDMTDGQQVHFEDFFENFEKNKREIIKAVYSSVIASTEKYLATHGDSTDSCEGVNTLETLMSASHEYTISSDAKSLIIEPSYPHVIEACVESVTVPISSLSPFLARNSVLKNL